MKRGLSDSPVRVSVPHQLGRAEARRRIENGLVHFKPKIDTIARGVEFLWTGDDLTFRAVALGQPVQGYLTVREATVDVEVSLQGMLTLFKEVCADRIDHYGVRLLAPEH